MERMVCLPLGRRSVLRVCECLAEDGWYIARFGHK